MKKSFLLCAPLALTLFGCASTKQNFSPDSRTITVLTHDQSEEPHYIQVGVLNDESGNPKIFVDNENLRIPETKPGSRPHKIWWFLNDSSARRYVFDKRDGIVPDENRNQIVRCKRDAPTVFSCVNRHDIRGKIKYTVKLVGDPQTEPLDPIIVND